MLKIASYCRTVRLAVLIILEGIFNGLGEHESALFLFNFHHVGRKDSGKRVFVCLCSMEDWRIIWICMVADNVTRCLLLGTRFLRGSWKKKFIRRG